MAESTHDAAESRHAATGKLIFGAAVFVSAFLLFQVQPMSGKCILPWFGGTPAVWTTCMLFFQTALFGGYTYAHLLTTRVKPRWQGVFHLTLVAIALAATVIIPQESWKPQDGHAPVGRILMLLAVTVGLPYFILSATGPLLQRWFSVTYPGHSPYRLYALSNIASLAALLSYPFLFEPSLTLGRQAWLWTLAFGLFGALCCGCVWQMSQVAQPASDPDIGANPLGSFGVDGPFALRSYSDPQQLTLGLRLKWLILPGLASVMLLAVTNQVCQDVAAVPFLWVAPLALYLLSFILTFDSPRWYLPRTYALCGLAASIAVVSLVHQSSNANLYWQITVYFGLLFTACMVCHGELVRSKPEPQHLTSFYLTTSAGGALGGLFVGVLSPFLFPMYVEFTLAVIACAVLMAIVWSRGEELVESDLNAKPENRLWMRVGAAAVCLVLATALPAQTLHSLRNAAITRRNFYGVLRVENDNSDPQHPTVQLVHGRILHGLQMANPAERNCPTAYYGPNGGAGRAIAALRQKRPQLRIGVVGLGAGTLATYGVPGDYFRFYEINPDVVALAESHFTFLSDCPAKRDTLIGDGRLCLEHEASQQFDLLVVDAFSGDAIPTHLLTREALVILRRHLRSDGLLALHISNLHFNLRPVVDALAEDAHLQTCTVLDLGTAAPNTRGSVWALLATNSVDLAAFAAQSLPVQSRRVLWTDDFSNLLDVLQ